MIRYFFFFFFLSHFSTAQTLYLRPQLGKESQFSAFVDRGTKPRHISKVPSSGLTGGIAFMLDVNKWLFEVNLYNGDAGTGASYKVKSDSSDSERSGSSKWSSYENRLSLNVSKPVKRITIYRKKYNSIDKLLRSENKPIRTNFDINLLAGLAFARFPQRNRVNNINNRGFNVSINTGNNLDNIADVSLVETSLIRKNGIRLELGSYIQFYNNNGDKRLRLGFLYGLGLAARRVFVWETRINNVVFPNFKTVTRGTTFSAYISYPIKLKTFNKKDKA